MSQRFLEANFSLGRNCATHTCLKETTTHTTKNMKLNSKTTEFNAQQATSTRLVKCNRKMDNTETTLNNTKVPTGNFITVWITLMYSRLKPRNSFLCLRNTLMNLFLSKKLNERNCSEPNTRCATFMHVFSNNLDASYTSKI